MKEIDVTGERFDFVDYSEGNIFFDSFSEGKRFEMKIWGATLMHELGIVERDAYIAAISDLIFEDVVYIDMYYGVYTDEQGSGFVKDLEGKSTDMYLRLGKKQLTNGYKEYILGGILGRYIGYGEITIYCRGAIKLRFDESALIDATEFCMNTKKYRFH